MANTITAGTLLADAELATAASEALTVLGSASINRVLNSTDGSDYARYFQSGQAGADPPRAGYLRSGVSEGVA
jgi:hypothetical protein